MEILPTERDLEKIKIKEEEDFENLSGKIEEILMKIPQNKSEDFSLKFNEIFEKIHENQMKIEELKNNRENSTIFTLYFIIFLLICSKIFLIFIHFKSKKKKNFYEATKVTEAKNLSGNSRNLERANSLYYSKTLLAHKFPRNSNKPTIEVRSYEIPIISCGNIYAEIKAVKSGEKFQF